MDVVMSNQLFSGLVALVAGGVVSIILFVPFTARVYRVRGRLTLGHVLTGLAAAVYFWAIWTYTLLPLPDGPITHCVGINLDPMEAVADVAKAFAEPGNPLLHPGITQQVLNVALFVPLGVFVRIFLGRGVIVAALAGLGVSLLVETTQATGVWGLYECAYRLGDVNDLMTNTAGAILGSLLSLLIPARWLLARASADADLPRPATRGRRVLAMVCDVLAFWLVGAVVSVITQSAVRLLARDLVTDHVLSDWLGNIVPIAVWFVVTMLTGRSIGDLVVRLRYVGGPQPEAVARFLRFVGGIAGITAVSWMPPAGGLLTVAMWITAVVLVFTTKDGRGLPGALSGRVLADSRAPVATAATVEA